jgi:hypothetical protein
MRLSVRLRRAVKITANRRREVATTMKTYITTHAAKSVIVTVIAGVCVGSVAAPSFAATTPAAAATHTTISKIIPKDTPWP